MRRRIRRILIRSGRCLFVGVALLGYLATAFGFPLPVRPIKDHSIPFPCQDRPCGCRNSVECWESCCCFTREEHLAWARANNVEPPAGYVEGGWNDRPQRQENKSCCGQKQSCCSVKKHDTGTGCCSTGSSCESQPTQKATERSPTRSQTWIVGSFFQTCRGLTVAWVQAGAVMPPPASVALANLPVSESICFSDQFAPFLSTAPPLPPPRVAPIA